MANNFGDNVNDVIKATERARAKVASLAKDLEGKAAAAEKAGKKLRIPTPREPTAATPGELAKKGVADLERDARALQGQVTRAKNIRAQMSKVQQQALSEIAGGSGGRGVRGTTLDALERRKLISIRNNPQGGSALITATRTGTNVAGYEANQAQLAKTRSEIERLTGVVKKSEAEQTAAVVKGTADRNAARSKETTKLKDEVTKRTAATGGGRGGGGRRPPAPPTPPSQPPPEEPARRIGGYTFLSPSQAAQTLKNKDAIKAYENSLNRAIVSDKNFAAAEANAQRQSSAAVHQYGASVNTLRKHGAATTEFLTALGRGQASIREIGYQAAATAGKFGAWTAASFGVFAALDSIVKVSKGAIAAQSGAAGLKRFIPDIGQGEAVGGYTKTSRELNVGIQDVADSQSVFARVFKNETDSLTAARTALLAYKLDNIEAADSNRYFTAIIQEWGATAQELPGIFDQISAAQRRMGARVSEVLPAVARSAAAVKNANGDLTDLIAIAATAQVASGQTGNTVGTALARGASNFSRSPSSQKVFEKYGLNNSSFTQLIIDAAKKAQSLSGAERTEVAKAIGGPQYGARIFQPVLNNYARLQRTRGVVAPGAAAGSAQQELDEVLKRVDEKVKRIGTDLEQLGANLQQSGLLSGLGVMLEVLDKTFVAANGVLRVFNALPAPLRTTAAVAAQLYVTSRLLRKANVGAGLEARGGALGAIGQRIQGGPGATQFRQLQAGLGSEVQFYQGQREALSRRSAELATQHERAVIRQGQFLSAGPAIPAGANAAKRAEAELRFTQEANAIQAKVNTASDVLLDAKTEETIVNEKLAAITTRNAEITAAGNRNARAGLVAAETYGVQAPVLAGHVRSFDKPTGERVVPVGAAAAVEGEVAANAALEQATVVNAEAATALAASEAKLAAAATAAAAETEAAAAASKRSATGLLARARGIGIGGALGGALIGFIAFDEIKHSMEEADRRIADEAHSLSTPSQNVTGVRSNLKKITEFMKQGIGQTAAGMEQFQKDTKVLTDRYAKQSAPSVRSTYRTAHATGGLSGQSAYQAARARVDDQAAAAARGQKLSPNLYGRSYDELETALTKAGTKFDGNPQRFRDYFRKVTTAAYHSIDATQNGGKGLNAALDRLAAINAAFFQKGKPSKSDPFSQFRAATLDQNTAYVQTLQDQAALGNRAPHLFSQLSHAFVFSGSIQGGTSNEKALQALQVQQQAVIKQAQDDTQRLLDKAERLPAVKRAPIYRQALNGIKRDHQTLQRAFDQRQQQLRNAVKALNDLREQRALYRERQASHGIAPSKSPFDDQISQLSQQTKHLKGTMKILAKFLQVAFAQLAALFGSVSGTAKQTREQIAQDQQQRVQEQLQLLAAQGGLAEAQAGKSGKSAAAINSLNKQLAYAKAHGADQTTILGLEADIANAQQQAADDAQQRAEDLRAKQQDAISATYDLKRSTTDDPTKLALYDYQEAKALARTGGTPADRKREQARVNETRRGRAEALRNRQIEHAELYHDIGRISDQQLINVYEKAIKDTKTGTEYRRQLREKLLRLKHDASQSDALDLNVGNIRLPTIYDIRRFVKQGTQTAPVNLQQSNSYHFSVRNDDDVQRLGNELRSVHGANVVGALRSAGFR